MKLFNRKPKTTQAEKEESEMTNHNEETREELAIDFDALYKDTFEAIADKILEHETIMESPIDGTLIGVVRTEDILNCITEYYGIKIEETKFSQYKK